MKMKRRINDDDESPKQGLHIKKIRDSSRIDNPTIFSGPKEPHPGVHILMKRKEKEHQDPRENQNLRKNGCL